MPKRLVDEKVFPLNLGENVRGKIEDNLLTMVVDLSAVGTLSNSKKSMILAGTGGNKTVGTGALEAKIGLNVYRKVQG